MKPNKEAIAEGADHTSRGGHFGRPTRLALPRSQQNELTQQNQHFDNMTTQPTRFSWNTGIGGGAV